MLHVSIPKWPSGNSCKPLQLTNLCYTHFLLITSWSFRYSVPRVIYFSFNVFSYCCAWITKFIDSKCQWMCKKKYWTGDVNNVNCWRHRNEMSGDKPPYLSLTSSEQQSTAFLSAFKSLLPEGIEHRTLCSGTLQLLLVSK
jgi:hypothetical protein